MTTLVIILYLAAEFGGTTHAVLTFESLAACETMVKQVRKFTFKHEIVQPCTEAK